MKDMSQGEWRRLSGYRLAFESVLLLAMLLPILGCGGDSGPVRPAPVNSGALDPDPDADGLSTIEEYALGTNPAAADTDGDGLSDGEEATAGQDGYLTDPLQADTDQDGLSDLHEVENGLNPTADDTDLDGVGDGNDNCPMTPNGRQRDGDGDGVGDVCDGCVADSRKTHPGYCGCNAEESDTDADGLLDCGLRAIAQLAGAGPFAGVAASVRYDPREWSYAGYHRGSRTIDAYECLDHLLDGEVRVVCISSTPLTGAADLLHFSFWSLGGSRDAGDLQLDCNFTDEDGQQLQAMSCRWAPP